MIQEYNDIGEEQLLAALLRWHPNHKSSTTLELVELELKSLKDNILNKSKHGQWQAKRRKLEFTEAQSANLLQQSQNFLSQLQKNLKATQRQCNKRMQKIQKECLHRQIKIKSMLNEQILLIVEENKILQVNEQQLEPYLTIYKAIEQKLKQQRKKQNEFLLNCQLQIEQFKSQNNKMIKQIKKQHQAKMLELKKKLKKIQELYSQKIAELKFKREKTEKHILQVIEDKIKGCLKV